MLASSTNPGFLGVNSAVAAGRKSAVAGIILMLASMAILPFLDVVAKYLGRQGVPVWEIVWARLFFGAFLTLPFALKMDGTKGLIPQNKLMNTLRAIFLIAATAFFFWALKYLSIADCLAIFFVNPLIVTMLSPVFLGEQVGRRRWIAVIIGFIGTLVIIRPGFQQLNPGVILALGAGLSLAVYILLTRKIAGRADPMMTTFHTNFIGAVIMCFIVVFVWIPPAPGQWLLFVLLAFFANLGHYLLVKAYDHAEASLLAPLAYTEIIMATIAGWWFFGDFPDRWTFLGVGILIACAIYISYRERLRHVPSGPEYEQP